MRRLLVCLLLLALSACGGGVRIAQVRTAADVGGEALTLLDGALAIPAGAAAQRCGDAAQGSEVLYLQCMQPWLRAIDAIDAAHALREAMIASLDGAELAGDNPAGMIACYAEAISHAISAAEALGVRIESDAARSWARFAGTLGTMCLYSTDSTLSSGSAEGG